MVLTSPTNEASSESDESASSGESSSDESNVGAARTENVNRECLLVLIEIAGLWDWFRVWPRQFYEAQIFCGSYSIQCRI